MIALLLALGCRDKEDTGADQPAADPVVPAEGTWEFAWAELYEGDCVLENMATGQPPTAEWRVELEANGFTFYDETGYPVGCDLQPDGAFFCSEGEYSVDYAQSGYDAVEVVGTVLQGAFADAESLEGTFEISAACYGEDCGTLGQANGPDFAYPCTAKAPFTGAWLGE